VKLLGEGVIWRDIVVKPSTDPTNQAEVMVQNYFRRIGIIPELDGVPPPKKTVAAGKPKVVCCACWRNVEFPQRIDMAILKEWRCLGHGPFENFDGKCPKGCPSSLVQREIRTAPAYERRKQTIHRPADGFTRCGSRTDRHTKRRCAVRNTSALQVMQSKKENRAQTGVDRHSARCRGIQQERRCRTCIQPIEHGHGAKPEGSRNHQEPTEATTKHRRLVSRVT
jgi:hypothetical protein